jgi:hypothetical protein
MQFEGGAAPGGIIVRSFLAIVVHGSSRGRRPLDPGLVQLLLLMFLHVVESLVSKIIVDDVGKHLILA